MCIIYIYIHTSIYKIIQVKLELGEGGRVWRKVDHILGKGQEMCFTEFATVS